MIPKSESQPTRREGIINEGYDKQRLAAGYRKIGQEALEIADILDSGMYADGNTNPLEMLDGALSGLTDRELDTAGLVALGFLNKEIARWQFVTEQTVKFHLTNVYRKTGVTNRTALSRLLYGVGFLDWAKQVTGDGYAGRELLEGTKKALAELENNTIS